MQKPSNKPKNIGIIVPNLGANQMGFFALNYVNNLVTQTNVDCTLFYEELVQPCTKPLCATLNISEIWSFNGILISTTIDNTLFSIKSVAAKRKLFYVWDLEWIRRKKNYMYNLQAYQNIELITRSFEYARLLENYCNKKVKAIVPDFNLYGILEYVEKNDG